MPAPTTRLAYTAIYDIFAKALEDPKGIRMQLPDYNTAVHMRMRMHKARSIDREDSLKLYSPEDRRHGVSVYDGLQLRIRTDTDNETWLYIEPRTADIIGDIEYLSDNEDIAAWQLNSPPKLISHSGTEPSEKKSESESIAPTEDSSLQPSTKPEIEPKTTGLRRL